MHLAVSLASARIRLEWTGLDWTGLDWSPLDSTRLQFKAGPTRGQVLKIV